MGRSGAVSDLDLVRERVSLGLDLLEEALEVTGLVVEEGDLLLALLGFDVATSLVPRVDRLNLALQLNYFV